MKPTMNVQVQKYTSIFGKVVIIALLGAMVFVGFMGAAYRHSGVAHTIFGKTDAADPLFFDPNVSIENVPTAVAEPRTDGACGCPYCCPV